MRAALVIVLALPALAGCLGGDAPETSDATDAVRTSHSEADRRYEYVLFLGVTGTEGDLDWALYEDALNGSASPGPAIAHAFDQDRPYGSFADGRLGSWLTTHFAYDEDRRLIGGLYTQILADGTRDAVFASFKGPYAGTTALPELQQAQAAFAHQLAAPAPLGTLDGGDPEESVLCTLKTQTDDWDIDSRRAAEIAVEVPEFRTHLEKYPEGEVTYHYFPGLGVEEGCPATLGASGNHWTIYHTDLDAYLDGDVPAPTAARVKIDAASGEVMDVDVGPLYIRPPLLLETVIESHDPVVPRNGPVAHNVTVPVEPGAHRLELTAYRTEWPEPLFDDETVLRMPDGRIHERTPFDQSLHRYVVDGPAAGEWSLEYRYRSMASDGAHTVEVHGLVQYG